MPERGRSELNFRAGEATDVRVAIAQCATAQVESCARGERALGRKTVQGVT